MSYQVPKYNAFEDEYRKPHKDFYRVWLKAWETGEALDIDNQYSYLFIYIKKIIKSFAPRKIISELFRLKSEYPQTKARGSESFHSYCNLYIAEAYIKLGEIGEAIAILYEALALKNYAFIDHILSLKFYEGEDISGREILRFRHAKSYLTKFGKKNLVGVEGCLDTIINQERERLQSTLLEHWLKSYELPKGWASPKATFELLEGRFKSKIPFYYVEGVSYNYISIGDWIRQAENLLRENRGIPRVGEGWISETELYYKIKDHFIELEVVQHASPKWLGRQHLDIYIPKLKVAIEYQGLLHDEPVDFFGGVEAYEKTKERDLRKRMICKKKNIKLVYVYPNYDFEEVIQKIKE